MNIGYGQMDAQVNSNLHDHSFGCVVFIRKHCWNFFETGHGKGEHDGAGACIKRVLRRYQMNHFARRLANAEEVVQWCKNALSHEINPSREVQRYIQFNLYW